MKQKVVAILLVGVLLTGMCLSGCQAEQGESKEDSAAVQKSDVLTDTKEEYYMLPISDYTTDIDEILEYLIDDYDIYKAQVQMTEEEIQTSDAGHQIQYQYTLETGGPAYKWDMNNSDYMFGFAWRKYADGVIDSNSASVSVTDTEEAKKIAMDVAELFDADLEFYREATYQNYDINNNPAEVVANYDFRQTYKGVPLAFMAFIDANRQELYSPSFYAVVDGNGLCLMDAFALVEIGEPIQTYHSKEFISLGEVERKIENYCVSFNTNIGVEGYEMTATIEEGEIVYIPYLEKNEKVLIPAYELVVIEDSGAEVWKVKYIVDVFTGYVYHRAGFDKIS